MARSDPGHLNEDGDEHPDESHDEDLGEDLDAKQEPIEFRRFVRVCPACKQPITADMDSCPYCGDVLFRYLADGTFAPRKGPMVKVFSVLIILLVALAVLGLLLSLLFVL